MYPVKDAKVALSHCREGKKIYGVRMEKTSLGWKYDWAFQLNDVRAKSEGYGNEKITGAIYPDAEYPGCPYCKANAFIVCGSCGKLNCNNTKESKFTCGWCGATGDLIDYSGDGISSSGNAGHLQYVIDCMHNNTTKVGNIKAYMITALYNAPNTISHYYQAEVNHDMYGVG